VDGRDQSAAAAGTISRCGAGAGAAVGDQHGSYGAARHPIRVWRASRKYNRRNSIRGEEILVYFFDMKGLLNSNPDIMLDHQLR
jgi:hypothetical protein